MSIKFECACGRRMSAPDGSSGRWVRCPNCQTKMPVPGGPEPEALMLDGGSGGALSLAGHAVRAGAWDADRADRREKARQGWLSPAAEQWLIENGVWVPAGIAAMAAAALVGGLTYALGGLTILPICGFVFMVGLGCFLYGKFAED